MSAPPDPAPAPDGRGSAPGERSQPFRWQLIGVRPPHCPFGAHRAEPSFDESARRLSHSELAAAMHLVGEGHRVRSRPDQPGIGPSADLDVCGNELEVKAWVLDVPRQQPVSARSVCNKLLLACRQGTTTLLWARGTGLSALDAQRGVDLFAQSRRRVSTTTVRVIGDGFDLAWGRQPVLRVTGAAPEAVGGTTGASRCAPRVTGGGAPEATCDATGPEGVATGPAGRAEGPTGRRRDPAAGTPPRGAPPDGARPTPGRWVQGAHRPSTPGRGPEFGL